MTERTFRVERNGILMFETNLNPGDGVFLSSAAETYIASVGAEPHPDIAEDVVGEIKVEAEDSESPAVAAVIEEMEAETFIETDDEYTDWTVAQLKEELGNRGLPVSGTKAELIERLEDDDNGV
jgi:hypothetical protein